MPPHHHHSSLCKARLQKARSLPYHWANQPSRIPVSAFSNFPDSQCFPCLSPWTIPSFLNSKRTTSSTPTHGIIDRGGVWGWPDPWLPLAATITSIFGLMERLPHFGCHVGTNYTFTKCSQSYSRFSSTVPIEVGRRSSEAALGGEYCHRHMIHHRGR